MKICPFIFCILFLIPGIGGAQHASEAVQYDELLLKIEQSIRAGNKRSLRDLGSLLDKPALESRVLSILQNRTFLEEEELEIKKGLSKADFLEFYYEKEDSLNFSPLLEAFYMKSLYKHAVNYKTQAVKEIDEQMRNFVLRKSITNIHEALDKGDGQVVLNQIDSIAGLDKMEAYQYLLELLLEPRLKKIARKYKEAFYLKISEALVRFPEMESLEAMLMIVENEFIPNDRAVPLLAKLTNIHLPLNSSSEELVEQYRHYVDSLGAIEILRQHGYNRLFNYRSAFFHEQVDYFGKLLNESDPYPWIQHNAFLDLMETEHPRAMFYLASQIYKIRNFQNAFSKQQIRKYVGALKKLTNLEVGIQNRDSVYIYEPYATKDDYLRRKMMVYWTKHYQDYEWDDNYLCFTNKHEAAKITQNYERLFRRLNSRNDSVAIQSFILLTNGAPGKVIELAQKYRQLLRTYNSSLPSFKHKYLEQLVQLTDYCKRNGITYNLDDQIRPIADSLMLDLHPRKRFAFENRLIQELSLKDVTALEYYACLHESNKEFSFSTGRILDYFYSKNWQEILLDDNQLRLYLKKSQLFEGIGVFGSCNYYLVKFDLNDPELQAKLNRLGRVESDEAILNQMSQLVVEPEVTESFGLADFLEDPTLFDRRDINILPAPGVAGMKKIFRQIKESEDTGEIRQLFYYLRMHPSLDMVKHAFSLIDNDLVLVDRDGLGITVGDFTIPIIEEVYNYSYPPEGEAPFATDKWRQLWRTDGKKYKEWGQRFFEEKLNKVLAMEELSIQAINELLESPHLNATYKKQCLSALAKVSPFKDVKRLHTEPRLSVKEDLTYFQDFFFGYKDLDDITKLFDVDNSNAALMLTYLQDRSKDFSFSELGSFYNNLFRQPWVVNYLNSGQCDPAIIQSIKEALLVYLDESDYLSEYEEQTTNLHIAQVENVGRSIPEQLQFTLQLDLDEGSRAKIQQSIIATVSYDEIGSIASTLSEFGPQMGQSPFQFLYKDFGLPIFDMEDPQVLLKFIENHKKMTEYEFYKFYQNEFGVEYKNKKGELDYEKIDAILQFDIVTSFVSRTGGKRDYFSYGIIKLLELEFKTRLGFHEKLNENQTFYTFSSAKRAAAWRNYLLEHKLVSPKPGIPPSFSQAKREE